MKHQLYNPQNYYKLAITKQFQTKGIINWLFQSGINIATAIKMVHVMPCLHKKLG